MRAGAPDGSAAESRTGAPDGSAAVSRIGDADGSGTADPFSGSGEDRGAS
ncbi:hypothetical protein Psi01_31130 [Planobispora siamensis]|uniref:Uncharacterized protein n=1 Tax=Planobispora siamensis TaxID=936338 RepID=A0A8J3SE29_9ACTN|nr:hypothetical protein Psi01_31130 [Planobispora siamensis]